MFAGERPFKCTECSAAFAQRNYLKDHLRTHTGEKPFQCDICQMCFSQRTSLRLHKKSHLNPQNKRGARGVGGSRGSGRWRKEGSTLDRMISTLAQNKQRKTKQAKEQAEALGKRIKAHSESGKIKSGSESKNSANDVMDEKLLNSDGKRNSPKLLKGKIGVASANSFEPNVPPVKSNLLVPLEKSKSLVAVEKTKSLVSTENSKSLSLLPLEKTKSLMSMEKTKLLITVEENKSDRSGSRSSSPVTVSNDESLSFDDKRGRRAIRKPASPIKLKLKVPQASPTKHSKKNTN